MLLPMSIREALVNDLEEFLGNLPDDPDAEMVTAFILEQLEVYADERGIDDIVSQLEESGNLEESLPNMLESEMASNEDFEFTEEECVSLLEEMCEIEWDDDEDDLTDEEDDELEEEEEEID